MAGSVQLANYNPRLHDSHTLLPENIAGFITAVTLAARLSLRCSSLLIEALFETAKYSTAFSFGLSRQTLISALSSAKRLHALTCTGTDSPESENGAFLQVLDKYTNLGVYVIHHTFTLAELFALSGLQLTSQAIKSGFVAAEESVGVIDGIFGSNETSRAIASIVSLLHRELVHDPSFELATAGKVAVLSGLTKAMTAFAVLQNVTHKRTMKHVKTTLIWKGLVVEAEKSEQLIEFHSEPYEHDEQHRDVIHELEAILATHRDEKEEMEGAAENNEEPKSVAQICESPPKRPATTQGMYPASFSPYKIYEVSTTTKRTTTKTMRIRPLDAGNNPDQQKAKYVVVKSNEEDKGSFVAILGRGEQGPLSPKSHAGTWIAHPVRQVEQDEHSRGPNAPSYGQAMTEGHCKRSSQTSNPTTPTKGLMIMLSAVSKKLTRKKVEREERYDDVREDPMTLDTNDGDAPQAERDAVAGSVTTVTSTSTTLRQYATDQQEKTEKISPATSIERCGSHNEPRSMPKPEPKIKRQSSWGRLRLKAGRKKSTTNLLQKGTSSSKRDIKKKSPNSTHPPPPTTNSSQHPACQHGSSHSANAQPAVYERHSLLYRSNSSTSIASISSLSHTMTTTTFTNASSSSSSTTPPPSSQSPTRKVTRSPSVPLYQKKAKRPRLPLDTEPDPRSFPRQHLITNIAHFMRYASAAYGESFMRILGIGDIPKILPFSHRHHPNHHAFSYHTKVMVEDILLSSYTENSILSMEYPQLHSLVHYVTADHVAKAIVLTCRGTLGLSDVLTDLTCEYSQFSLPTNASQSYIAHGGMLEAAQLLAKQKGKVFQVVREGLERYPSYGLVLCGHSLGAGVASLLSVLWSEERPLPSSKEERLLAARDDAIPFVTSSQSGLPARRPIHCYTYGPPCVMSLELSEYCGRGLVTSVVHAFDIVGSLSLGLLKDFKNVAISLHQESKVADEILSRILGRFQRGRSTEQSSNSNSGSGSGSGSTWQGRRGTGEGDESDSMDEDDQWFWALIKTMRADMRAEKLYPPSTVYVIESEPQLVQHSDVAKQSPSGASRASQHKRAHMVALSRCDDVQARFSEIVFSRTMFMDHSPNMYEKAILQLCRGYFGSSLGRS